VEERLSSGKGDKAFVEQVEAVEAQLGSLAAIAATVKPTRLYRESCRDLESPNGLDVGMKSSDGETAFPRSVTCDVELTSLDDAVAPTGSVIATATANPAQAGEHTVSAIKKRNADALLKAQTDARAALFAKVNAK
jgi:hypothetical protein